MISYTPLALHTPSGDCNLRKSSDTEKLLSGFDAPALELMTDFSRMPAITVPASTQVDTALDRMIFSGVRLLLVVDKNFNLLGSITSYDIQSEKPLRFMQSKDCQNAICTRDDVTVQDIMTPLSKWRVLSYDNLVYATLGDIVQTFKSVGQRHIFVIEKPDDRSSQTIRGLYSATDIERALGFSIGTASAATNFADITKELAG